MRSLHTRLCDLLGIEYPIVQSGMSRVAGPELVAEVCRAGGFGILAGLRLTPDELRAQIRRIRELTDKPFGVNQWQHPDLRRPVDLASVDARVLDRVQRTLKDRETIAVRRPLFAAGRGRRGALAPRDTW